MKIGSLSIALVIIASFGVVVRQASCATVCGPSSLGSAPTAAERLGSVSDRRLRFPESFGHAFREFREISVEFLDSLVPPRLAETDDGRADDPDGFTPVLQMLGASEDCNGNSVDDAIEIAAGAVPDGDGDGVPDECNQSGCPTRALRVTGAGGAIPDAGEGSLVRTITVPAHPGNPPIQSLRVTLDLAHTWTSDLRITLRRGDDEPVTLLQDCGSFHDLNGRYHFTDLAWEGAAGLTPLCEGQLVNQGGSSDESMFRFAPGTYRPTAGTADTGFQSIRGLPMAATWTLSITDTRGNEAGTLDGWSIQFRFAEPSPADCDGNGVADSCEIAQGGAADEDADGEPDRCERARGDLNLDGRIGPADLTILLGLWGQVNPPYGDFNADGIIGPADLAFLLGAWSPAAPEISGVSPGSGPAAGGTVITITGTNLTGAAAVKVGGTVATSLVAVNATTVTAVTPSGSAGARDVTVTTPGGNAAAANAFTYIAPPAIWSVTPSSGPAAGGTAITITGANLSGTSSVMVGGVAATGVTVVSPTRVMATTPAATAGARDVLVTTADGTAIAAGAFTFIAAPAISAVAPNTGPVTGGTPIMITGSSLAGTTSVKVGGVAATGVVVVNATTVTAVTPAGTVGTKDVAVATAGGTATLAGAFMYVAAPTISSVSPHAGPVAAARRSRSWGPT